VVYEEGHERDPSLLHSHCRCLHAYGHYYSPATPLPYDREYNEHFASESRRVAVITTTIRMIRTAAQPEGNTGECAGGGSAQLEGGKGAAWFASKC